jgi:uncharacterized membrane protein
MKGRFRFLKTTVIGGLVFLVPIIIIVAIIGKAFEIMKKVADPLGRRYRYRQSDCLRAHHPGLFFGRACRENRVCW